MLWFLLAPSSKAEGLRFRRQCPVSPYVADFACLSARLLVELDGLSHDLQPERDRDRESWLRGQGFEILRFSNQDVYENCESVVATILNAAHNRKRMLEETKK